MTTADIKAQVEAMLGAPVPFADHTGIEYVELSMWNCPENGASPGW